MYSWLSWTSYLSLLISLSVLILEIIAFWKIFEKAGEHWRYIFIPWFNLFVLSRIAGRTDLFLYMIWWFSAAILFAFLNIYILVLLSSLFVGIIAWIISYSIAKNFWRTNSAALVFVVSPINYLVLWFSDDQYIYQSSTNHTKIQISPKNPIDENILKDIEEEIHTKHLWEYEKSNTIGGNDWDDDIWSWNFKNTQNIPNVNDYPNNWNTSNIPNVIDYPNNWNTPNIYS